MAVAKPWASSSGISTNSAVTFIPVRSCQLSKDAQQRWFIMSECLAQHREPSLIPYWKKTERKCEWNKNGQNAKIKREETEKESVSNDGG